MWFVRGLWCGAVLAFGTDAIAQSPVIAATENLVADGIPAIPAEIAESVRRYTNPVQLRLSIGSRSTGKC